MGVYAVNDRTHDPDSRFLNEHGTILCQRKSTILEIVVGIYSSDRIKHLKQEKEERKKLITKIQLPLILFEIFFFFNTKYVSSPE